MEDCLSHPEAVGGGLCTLDSGVALKKMDVIEARTKRYGTHSSECSTCAHQEQQLGREHTGYPALRKAKLCEQGQEHYRVYG